MKNKQPVVAIIFAVICLFVSLEPVGASQLARYVRTNPDNPEILNSYGIELANTGNLIEAIRVWRRALELSPGNVHLYNNIGSALKRLGHDEHAFKWYSAAIALQPTYWTYYNLALIYRDRNQNDAAVWALRQAVSLKQDFAAARELLNRLERGPTKTNSVVKLPVTAPEKNVSTRDIVGKAQASDAKSQTPTKLPSVRLPEKNVVLDPSGEDHSRPVRLPDDNGGQVFLTFDGGADDDGFDKIVACLATMNIRCTFFLTGRFARKYPEKVRELLARGHEIANHSMNHPDMKNFSAAKIAAEIEAAEVEFEKVTGQRGAPFFRFPFGHQNRRVEKIVEAIGYRPVYWHIDTIDWREDPVKTIISRVDKKLRRGAVILMHVGSKNGAKALPRILDIISRRGYELARLSDLDPAQIAALP